MRLTKRYDNGVVMTEDAWLRDVLQKLADYEDTGYSPLEIKSLEVEWNAMRKIVDSYRDAEEQGQLVRLPCKVGDTLYAPTRNFISEFRVSQFDFGGYDEPYLWVEWYLTKGITGKFRVDGIRASEIGKTVFLTRAEAALRKGET